MSRFPINFQHNSWLVAALVFAPFGTRTKRLLAILRTPMTLRFCFIYLPILRYTYLKFYDIRMYKFHVEHNTVVLELVLRTVHDACSKMRYADTIMKNVRCDTVIWLQSMIPFILCTFSMLHYVEWRKNDISDCSTQLITPYWKQNNN